MSEIASGIWRYCRGSRGVRRVHMPNHAQMRDPIGRGSDKGKKVRGRHPGGYRKDGERDIIRLDVGVRDIGVRRVRGSTRSRGCVG